MRPPQPQSGTPLAAAEAVVSGRCNPTGRALPRHMGLPCDGHLHAPAPAPAGSGQAEHAGAKVVPVALVRVAVQQLEARRGVEHAVHGLPRAKAIPGVPPVRLLGIRLFFIQVDAAAAGMQGGELSCVQGTCMRMHMSNNVFRILAISFSCI